jgi:V/A-type H+-transporting ATPase subunit I
MTRVAVVAPAAALRDVLVRVADEGSVEFDRVVAGADLPMSDAARALQRLNQPAGQPPALSLVAPDIAGLAAAGRADLLAGEVELSDRYAQAIVRGEVAALLGWARTANVPGLAARLADVGGAAVPLPRPRGVDPPTAAPPGAVRRAFAPLVTTYATVPYVDVDPTVLAGMAYVVMFGAMFGDVGHGLLLLIGALVIRFGGVRRLAPLRPHWLFIGAASVAAMAFGFAYGECFGPTGLVPAGLIAPMEQPVPMLAGGVALGAVILGGAFVLGTVNRFREGGWALALYAPSGVAGALVFTAAGAGLAAWYWSGRWIGLLAVALAVTGVVLAYAGLFSGAGGGGAGAAQAGIEVVDLLIRLGANLVSFARLAAFGLTHAVLGWIVWTAAVGLWGAGGAAMAAAIVVFVLGNALTFGLEALVAGIQALRLEYYELFSRVFQLEGRPFQPWHVPLDPATSTRESSCPLGSSPYPRSPADASAH